MKQRTVQNQSNIKVNNCKLVLNIIRDKQDENISRATISKMTKMSATSITRITDSLMNLGLVTQAETVYSGTVGRNGIQLKILDKSVLTAGISIDSDYVDVCILDFCDCVIAMKRHELNQRPYQPEEILDIAHRIYEEACSEAGCDSKAIRTIGISCIGNVDYKIGKVYFAPQFQWEDVPLGEMAQRLFSQPVFVDNDMKASLVGLAHRHKEIGKQDVTYLSIGMGVGAAIMYGGTLMRGSNNAVGEVGHIIMERNGRSCDCGQRGCVQTYLTKNSFIEQCREEGHDIKNTEQIYEAFRGQEPWAVEFIDKQADHLALLIRNLVYMYNTEFILVGGATILDCSELFEITQGKLVNLLHANLYASLQLRMVKERDNSAVGAAFVAQEMFVERLLFEEGL